MRCAGNPACSTARSSIEASFEFIGTDAFFNRPGKLRAFRSGTSVIVEGNVNADSTPVFQIELRNFNNLAGLDASDFRL